MKKLILLITLCLFSSVSWAACVEGDCVNGQGTLTFPDGREYVGEWKDHKRHGQGTLTWPSGQKYVGQYKDGKRHGQGTLTLSWGRGQWVGEWRDGKKHKEKPLIWNMTFGQIFWPFIIILGAMFMKEEYASEAWGDSIKRVVLGMHLSVKKWVETNILRPRKNTESAVVSPLRPSARRTATRFIGGVEGYTLKIVLSLIFFVFLWAPFLSPFFTDAIGHSDYVVYGGESKAFIAGILQSAIWVTGMAPALWFWNKKRKASHVAASSTASEAQSTQGSKSWDELQPLKMIQAAQIADEVSSYADIYSVLQIASILSSEKEVMKALQEANEDIRDAYEEKVKDLFEEQGIDRESLTATAIESEVNRCMKLGLNKICLDERLVPLLGSQEIGK